MGKMTVVGCPHACKYCYASFMKRFTNHPEPWGTFLDVKYWPAIKHSEKYAGQRVVIGSVTDGYHPLEERYGRTRALLEQLQNSGAKITICTKSDLILRDLELLRSMPDVTVSWSINTLDEQFKDDMDNAASIQKRLDYIQRKYPELVPLYHNIYKRNQREYWKLLEQEMEQYAGKHGYPYLIAHLPDGRSQPGKPAVINYFYHETIRNSDNSGVRRL